ncbi:MAG: 50S ribosomal protein L10 [bacterium]
MVDEDYILGNGFGRFFNLLQKYMALTKNKKKEVVAEVTDLLGDAKTVVFVNFKGLTVGATNNFRRDLRNAGVGYKVAKKTLLKRVLDQKGLKGEMPEIKGEVGIAYSNDLLSPAREVFTFSKGKETPTIVGGIFDGEYVDAARMMSIATIPSREVLLAQVLNIINSPIQQFVVALSEIAKSKTV